MKHPKAIHDDILRVLFRGIGWDPWLLDDEKKCSRRTKRLCGLTPAAGLPKHTEMGRPMRSCRQSPRHGCRILLFGAQRLRPERAWLPVCTRWRFFQLLCEHVRASLAIAGDAIYSQHDVAGHVFDAFYHAYLKWLQRGGLRNCILTPEGPLHFLKLG